MAKIRPDKVLRVDLYEEEYQKYEEIKKWLGIRSDADVIRFLINRGFDLVSQEKAEAMEE